jgi:hypothetical protein
MLMLAALAAFVISCGGPGNNPKFKGGENRKGSEGWKDENTFVSVTVGLWDRNRYFSEDKKATLSDDDKKGKTQKSSLGLQDDSKRAATVKAMRDFLEKAVGAEIKSKTGVEDGALIADVIQSGVEGKVPSPAALDENYTPENDCRITFEFKADGLKKIISKATEDILKKNGKM